MYYKYILARRGKTDISYVIGEALGNNISLLIDQGVGVLSMTAGEEKHEHWELIYAGGDELL